MQIKNGMLRTHPPDEGVDTDASTETPVVPYAHKKFILGHHINTGIEVDRNSTNEGCKTDREEDRMEYRRKCHYERRQL